MFLSLSLSHTHTCTCPQDIIPSELEVGEGDGVLVGDGEGVEMGDLGDRGGDINTEQEITDSKTQK